MISVRFGFLSRTRVENIARNGAMCIIDLLFNPAGEDEFIEFRLNFCFGLFRLKKGKENHRRLLEQAQ